MSIMTNIAIKQIKINLRNLHIKDAYIINDDMLLTIVFKTKEDMNLYKLLSPRLYYRFIDYRCIDYNVMDDIPEISNRLL